MTARQYMMNSTPIPKAPHGRPQVATVRRPPAPSSKAITGRGMAAPPEDRHVGPTISKKRAHNLLEHKGSR